MIPKRFLFRISRLASAALLLTALVGCATLSNGPQAPQLLRLPYTSELDNSEREYFVYLPRGYDPERAEPWPVMLFLHGNGERGNGRDELDFVLAHGPLYEAWIQKQDLPFIIISPQLHMLGQDEIHSYIQNRSRHSIPQRQQDGTPARAAPFPTQGPMTGTPAYAKMEEIPITLPEGWDKVEQDLLHMVDHVTGAYHGDARRIYLTGLSYGGFGTWYMASRHPDRFAAIAPVVGWGHPQLMSPIAGRQVPVWAFAGGRDDVVQVQYFYPGLNLLEELGHTAVRFTTHEDMAHDAWRRVYPSQDLYHWMLEQELEENR
jgi:predicted peptidase